jgi:hypothetical protein
MVAGPEQSRQVQAPGDFFFDQSGMEEQSTAAERRPSRWGLADTPLAQSSLSK